MTSIDAQALAASLRRLNDGSNQHSLQPSLQLVIDACVQVFDVTGSGIMLADEQSVLRYAVSSSGTSQHLEEAQFATGEGPCVDTFVHERPTAVADLATDDRYPTVAHQVLDKGVVAILGVPVRLSGITVGSLDVYLDEPHPWDDSEMDALHRYAEVVEAITTAALSADQAGELAQQLNYALDYRVPIERGVGYLMARDALDHAAAFNKLRRSARNSRRKIGEVADHLLQTGRLPEEDR
jgi:GAF domain-containing protein